MAIFEKSISSSILGIIFLLLLICTYCTTPVTPGVQPNHQTAWIMQTKYLCPQHNKSALRRLNYWYGIPLVVPLRFPGLDSVAQVHTRTQDIDHCWHKTPWLVSSKKAQNDFRNSLKPRRIWDQSIFLFQEADENNLWEELHNVRIKWYFCTCQALNRHSSTLWIYLY